MNLREMLNSLRSKLVYLLVVPIVFGLLAFGGSIILIKDSFQATASISASAEIAAVKGIADSVTSTQSSADASLSASVATASSSVTIVAKGSSGDACVQAANRAISEVDRVVKTNLSNISTVTSSASAAKNTTPNRIQYGLMAYAGMLFILLLGFIIAALAKRIIYSENSVQEVLDIPLVGELGGTSAERERMLTTTRFLSEGMRKDATVCIIPAGDIDTATIVVDELSHLDNFKGRATAAPSLQFGASALISAHEADIVLLAIKQGVSTYTDTETITRELKLIGVQPAGYIYQKTQRGKQKEAQAQRVGKHHH